MPLVLVEHDSGVEVKSTLRSVLNESTIVQREFVQPVASVTVKQYSPASTFTKLSAELVNPLGPVQLYVKGSTASRTAAVTDPFEAPLQVLGDGVNSIAMLDTLMVTSAKPVQVPTDASIEYVVA